MQGPRSEYAANDAAAEAWVRANVRTPLHPKATAPLDLEKGFIDIPSKLIFFNDGEAGRSLPQPLFNIPPPAARTAKSFEITASEKRLWPEPQGHHDFYDLPMEPAEDDDPELCLHDFAYQHKLWDATTEAAAIEEAEDENKAADEFKARRAQTAMDLKKEANPGSLRHAVNVGLQQGSISTDNDADMDRLMKLIADNPELTAPPTAEELRTGESESIVNVGADGKVITLKKLEKEEEKSVEAEASTKKPVMGGRLKGKARLEAKKAAKAAKK